MTNASVAVSRRRHESFEQPYYRKHKSICSFAYTYFSSAEDSPDASGCKIHTVRLKNVTAETGSLLALCGDAVYVHVILIVFVANWLLAGG